MLNSRSVSFGYQEVQFLGHIVSNEGIKVDPAKIEAITNWEKLRTPTEVRMSNVIPIAKIAEDFEKIKNKTLELSDHEICAALAERWNLSIESVEEICRDKGLIE